MSERSTIIKERNRQADERLKSMSDLLRGRDSEANNRLIILMTTMQDLKLGVKAMVSQTEAAPARAAPAPLALNLENIPSTKAPHPPTQVT